MSLFRVQPYIPVKSAPVDTCTGATVVVTLPLCIATYNIIQSMSLFRVQP